MSESTNQSYDEMMRANGIDTGGATAIEAEFVEPVAAEQETVKRHPADREGIRIPLLVGAAACTVGLGAAIMLSVNGGKSQQSKGSSPSPTASAVASSEEKDKELADLRAEAFKVPSPSPATSPTAKPSPSESASASPSPAAAAPTKKPTAALTPVANTSNQKENSQTDRQIAALREEINQLRAQTRNQRSTPPASTMIAKAAPQPIAKSTPRPTPTPVAAPVVAKATPQPAATPSRKTEQIASARPTPTPTSQEEKDVAPTIRLPMGDRSIGHTANPIATLVGTNINQPKNGVPLIVTLDKAIAFGGTGYGLLPGTSIEFLATVAENGKISARSGKAYNNGKELALPEGALEIMGSGDQPLMANIRKPNGDEVASSDLQTAVWSGLAMAGQVASEAGKTTTSSTGYGGVSTTITNGQNPDVILAGAGQVFRSIANANTKRAEAQSKNLEKQAAIASLPINTRVNIYVVSGVAFKLPSDESTLNAMRLNQPAPVAQSPNSEPAPAPPTQAESNPSPLPIPSAVPAIARQEQNAAEAMQRMRRYGIEILDKP